MRVLHMVVAAFGCAVALSSHAAAGFPVDLDGKVVYVDDGDTLVLLDAQHRQVKVRLTDLDAPETGKVKYGKLGQPFGAAAGHNLSRLAKGRDAHAHCYEWDQHERLVCRVLVGGVDLSLEQIRAGYAWANGASRRYVRDERAYQYEREARTARRGLWVQSQPVEPWVWRRSCWQGGRCPGAEVGDGE